MTMWELIPKKRMPPTRLARYCCQTLKESHGAGNVVLTGIRHAESGKRAKRKLTETCRTHAKTSYLHPIIDWTESEVWEYIHTYHVPYCKLYDEGFHRLGCVGCPFGGPDQQRAQFARWPHIAKCYERAFDRIIAKRKADGLPCEWKDGHDVMKWWMMQNNRAKEDDRSIPLFGMMLDETDT